LDFLNLGDVEYDYSRLMQLYCSDLNYIADVRGVTIMKPVLITLT
jgi:hypothetical protein